MIGVDLLRKNLAIADARIYLGSPDAWVGLTIGELYTRLRDQGYLLIDKGGVALTVEGLVAAMTARTLEKDPDFVVTPPPVDEIPPDAGALVLLDFTCPQGHAWKAYAPYRWRTSTPPEVESPSICPYCVIDFAAKAFPAS